MPTNLDPLVISCQDWSTDHSATDPELPVSATSQEVRLAGISSVRQSELARWLADTALHANFTRRMQNTCTSQHPLQLPCCQPSNPRDSPDCLSFQGLDLVITIWPRLSKDFERDRDQANSLTTYHWDVLSLVPSPFHCCQGRAASPLAIAYERLLPPPRPPLSRLVSNRFLAVATHLTSRVRRRSSCLALPPPQSHPRNHPQCLSQSS